MMNTETRRKHADRPIQDSNTPASGVCLIDVSGSMAETDYAPSRIAAAREACAAYVKGKLRHGCNDHLAIVTFSGKAKVVYPLSHVGSHADKIIHSVRRIRPKSSTNFCSGLIQADQLLKPASNLFAGVLSALGGASAAETRAPANAFRHILFLSDGDHNHNSNPVEFAARLKNSGITIDCIGIGSRDEVNEELLRRIASVGENGEPRYRFIGDKDALLREFRRIATLRIL